MPNRAMSETGQAGPRGGAVATNGTGDSELKREQKILADLGLQVTEWISATIKGSAGRYRVSIIDHEKGVVKALKQTREGLATRKTTIKASEIDDRLPQGVRNTKKR